jgi:hypothetical protein
MARKKLIVLLLFGFIGINAVLFAQQDGKKQQKFEEFKEKRVAFITKAMGLNVEEAKTFWPLCNELLEKKFEVNRKMMKAMREFKQTKNHSESEYKKFVEFCAGCRVEEVKLEREYYTIQFPKVISFEKIFLYIQAEQQFARKILDERGDRPDDRPVKDRPLRSDERKE